MFNYNGHRVLYAPWHETRLYDPQVLLTAQTVKPTASRLLIEHGCRPDRVRSNGHPMDQVRGGFQDIIF